MAARTHLVGALMFLIAAAAAPALPDWIVSLATIAFANALVVLGLIVMWRAGLVSFGQALYYCIGAYTVALVARRTGFTDAIGLIILGGMAAGLVAAVVGFLLARYREIFFAMLSLALSMILYGVLVKSESLGSTDGFSVSPPTFLGYAPHGDALYEGARRIDQVFLQRGALEPLEARIVLDREGAPGVWPSDHFGLYVRFAIPSRR